ncbi:MAG: DUF4058 family protein [Cyanobacteria bacterium P01_D01_bin.1]
MPSPFPGMDPYIENAALWPNVHGRLIVAIANALSPQLLPKYQPIIEESVYRTASVDSVMIGRPDVAIQKTEALSVEYQPAVALMSPVVSPVVVELPIATDIRQRFIEIRNVANQEVVTVIEVLSPANKKGDGRAQYQRKRDRLLESQANLIEVDLLHKGDAMPMIGPTNEADILSHYRILVSPVELRPQALLYPFNLSQSLPQVAIPLRADDRAKGLTPTVDFQDLLNQVYEVSGYQFSIDYSQPPQPGWEPAESTWIKETVNQMTSR